MRSIVITSLAALGPSIQSNHIRLGPGFVNKDKGFEEFPKQLMGEFGPSVATGLYVRPISLVRT